MSSVLIAYGTSEGQTASIAEHGFFKRWMMKKIVGPVRRGDRACRAIVKSCS
jgi:hypothetical protein